MPRTLTTTCVLGGLLALSGVAHGQDARSAPTASADSAERQIVSGLASYRRLHFAEAEHHFRAAVDADAQSASAHYYLAYAIYKIAEPKRPNDPGKHLAAEEFAKAYAIDPDFKPGWGIHGP